MPESTIIVLQWTALIWGGAFILGLLAYAAEAIWILIEEG